MRAARTEPRCIEVRVRPATKERDRVRVRVSMTCVEHDFLLHGKRRGDHEQGQHAGEDDARLARQHVDDLGRSVGRLRRGTVPRCSPGHRADHVKRRRQLVVLVLVVAGRRHRPARCFQRHCTAQVGTPRRENLRASTAPVLRRDAASRGVRRPRRRLASSGGGQAADHPKYASRGTETSAHVLTYLLSKLASSRHVPFLTAQLWGGTGARRGAAPHTSPARHASYGSTAATPLALHTPPARCRPVLQPCTAALHSGLALRPWHCSPGTAASRVEVERVVAVVLLLDRLEVLLLLLLLALDRWIGAMSRRADREGGRGRGMA